MFSAILYLRIMKIGHRDIKPQNIICFKDDIDVNSTQYSFKLADFGVGNSFFSSLKLERKYSKKIF